MIISANFGSYWFSSCVEDENVKKKVNRVDGRQTSSDSLKLNWPLAVS